MPTIAVACEVCEELDHQPISEHLFIFKESQAGRWDERTFDSRQAYADWLRQKRERERESIQRQHDDYTCFTSPKTGVPGWRLCSVKLMFEEDGAASGNDDSCANSSPIAFLFKLTNVMLHSRTSPSSTSCWSALSCTQGTDGKKKPADLSVTHHRIATHTQNTFSFAIKCFPLGPASTM